MACQDCSQSSTYITGYIPANCQDQNGNCYTDSETVVYTGPDLSCLGVTANETLHSILQKISPLVCASTGDFSGYNTACLGAMATQQQFVETISNYVCTLRTDLNTFTGTSFVNYQSTVNSRFTLLELPGITCASAGVASSDTIQTVLSKYCAKFSSIDASLNLSGLGWTACFSGTTPTTVTQGFAAVLSQICILKGYLDNIGANSALPTFNNVGSCLPGTLTANDTLVDTVNKLKTRVCQTSVLDNSAITWGCVAAPTGNANLQGALTNIVDKINSLNQNSALQFSSDFIVTNVDNSNLCLGKRVALASSNVQDRFVAISASDNAPGVWQDKVVPGTGMNFDYLSTPGKVIVNGSVAGGDTYLVKTDAADTADYLPNKLVPGGITNGVQVLPTFDSNNHVVAFNVTVNPIALFTSLIEAANNTPALKTLLCNLVASCPSPCNAPSDITVTYTP